LTRKVHQLNTGFQRKSICRNRRIAERKLLEALISYMFHVRTMITALAGGVGAARFLTGLETLVSQKDLSIIVNTGDDIELFGLHISPDIDIVMYTLASIVDEEKGWGIRKDTFHCLEALRKFNSETWFNLGDKDLATHIFRTNLLKNGVKLAEVTARVGRLLGLDVAILPMTDDRFETRVLVEEGLVHFEEYFVKRGGKDEVLGVEFLGADKAKPATGVLESIMEAEKVIVCPSNPIVSIGTILAVKGVRDALRHTSAKKVAISPIVAGAPVKGPADKLMRGLGFEVSAFSVAELYSDFLDIFVLDTADSGEKGRIEELGIKVEVANTLMKRLEDKVELARTVLET
jgi:LPPG:FO 2-phospho-L-lactate transferase